MKETNVEDIDRGDNDDARRNPPGGIDVRRRSLIELIDVDEAALVGFNSGLLKGESRGASLPADGVQQRVAADDLVALQTHRHLSILHRHRLDLLAETERRVPTTHAVLQRVQHLQYNTIQKN